MCSHEDDNHFLDAKIVEKKKHTVPATSKVFDIFHAH
jgi:hypothetical protein